MANLKLGVMEWSDKQLHTMKVYLPYIIILTMSYWIVRQTNQIEEMRIEHNEHLEKDLQFARDAYLRSQEAYLLIINKKQ